MAPIVEKFVTTNSYMEKVEKRSYPSGRTRWYIYQGRRWYPIEAGLVAQYITEGLTIKDTGREDWIKYRIANNIL